MNTQEIYLINKHVDIYDLFNAVPYSPAEEAKECPYVKLAIEFASDLLDHSYRKDDFDFFDFVLFVFHPDYCEYTPSNRDIISRNTRDKLYLYKVAFCFDTLPTIGDKLTEFLCRKLRQETFEIKETNLD